jgi:hypothetical protein
MVSRPARGADPTREARAAPALRWPLPLLCAAALLAGLACTPTLDTPEDAAHHRDLRDADRVAQQLLRVPMIERASVTLTRGAADPLRAIGPPPASASAVVQIDARADASSIAADVRAVVTAVAPEIAADRVTVIARPRAPLPQLVHLGPFVVARSSRAPLLAAVLGLLVLCAGLGVALALRERAHRAPRS